MLSTWNMVQQTRSFLHVLAYGMYRAAYDMYMVVYSRPSDLQDDMLYVLQ